MINNVYCIEINVKFDGLVIDFESGIKINVGVEVKWEFLFVGLIVLEFGIVLELYINDFM